MFIPSPSFSSVIIAGASSLATVVVMKYGTGQITQSVRNAMKNPALTFVSGLVCGAYLGMQLMAYCMVYLFNLDQEKFVHFLQQSVNEA